MPNRSDTFNADILEKLVLRQSPEAISATVTALRSRARLSAKVLPSALSFTLVNAHAGVNCLTFSDDVTTVRVARVTMDRCMRHEGGF